MTDIDRTGTWVRPIAAITGAAGGMGRAIARRLGSRYRLALLDLDEGAVNAFRDALTEEGYDVAVTTTADVASADSVRAAADAVAAAGTLGTIVHTAGLSPSMSDWRTVVRVNLLGTAHVLDAFLPLAGPGSSAICISSTAAYTFPATPESDAVIDDPYADDLLDRLGPLLGDEEADPTGFRVRAYGASKRGVIRQVGLRVRDWATRGARIVSIAPGTIHTPMGRLEHTGNPLAIAAMKLTPLGREGMPSDIAAMADFLSSDQASYLTGSDFKVDGGIVAARTLGV